VGESPDQERMLAASEEFDNRRYAGVLRELNPRERRIFEGRRLAEDPITLAELADEFGVSRERVRQIMHAFLKWGRQHRAHRAELPVPLIRLWLQHCNRLG
jgi:RNA polymerase sigma-32 factor